MKTRFITPVMVVLSLLTFNCADDGETGPTGPVGPAGPVGPVGPVGATGTANVIYSEWFTPKNYVQTTVFGMKNFTQIAEAPEITQEILDNGVVLVYGKLLGYNPSIWPVDQVALLPINIVYIQGVTVTDTWSASATAGNLKITFVNSGNIYNTIAETHQFRYVIIPGGVALNGGRGSTFTDEDKQQLVSMSYEDVAAMFEIPD